MGGDVDQILNEGDVCLGPVQQADALLLLLLLLYVRMTLMLPCGKKRRRRRRRRRRRCRGDSALCVYRVGSP